MVEVAGGDKRGVELNHPQRTRTAVASNAEHEAVEKRRQSVGIE